MLKDLLRRFHILNVYAIKGISVNFLSVGALKRQASPQFTGQLQVLQSRRYDAQIYDIASKEKLGHFASVRAFWPERLRAVSTIPRWEYCRSIIRSTQEDADLPWMVYETQHHLSEYFVDFICPSGLMCR